jgi:hypothetical protein
MESRRSGSPGPGDWLDTSMTLIRGPPWWSAYQRLRIQEITCTSCGKLSRIPAPVIGMNTASACRSLIERTPQ